MTHCSRVQGDSMKKKAGSVADCVLLKLFCCVPENKIHTVSLCCRYPLSSTCQPISHTAQALNRGWMVEIGEQTPSCSAMLCGGCLACSCTTKCYKSETELSAKYTWEALGCEGPDRGMKGTREVFVQPMRHSFIHFSTLPSQSTWSAQSHAALAWGSDWFEYSVLSDFSYTAAPSFISRRKEVSER